MSDARRIRATYGTTASTSVATGRTIALGSDQGRPDCDTDTDGSQRKTVVENKATSRIPITNSGSAATPRSPTWMTWSAARSRRRAATIARRKASGMISTAARATRTPLFTTRDPISEATDPPLASDVPGSPRTAPPSHDRYRVTTGSSRLSWACSAATRSGVADRPRIARAGSPSAWVAPNTMTEISQRVSAARTRRCASQRDQARAGERTPGRPRPATPRAAGSPERDTAELVGGQREVLVRDEPGDLRRVGVDLVLEAPDAVAAAVVLDLLGILEQRGALGAVQLLLRLPDQPEELRVRPVGLVVRRVRHRPVGDLGEVAAGEPVVLGERPAQVLVAVEGPGVLVADLDRHAGLLRLLREQLCGLDGA